MNKTTLNNQKEKHSIANFYPRSPCGERRSVHKRYPVILFFYPRSPCGERRWNCDIRPKRNFFSIHALLAESDRAYCLHRGISHIFYPRSPCGERQSRVRVCQAVIHFLSTLSLRRATRCKPCADRGSSFFYPRSPCGERLKLLSVGPAGSLFLSTLSLRRATLPGSVSSEILHFLSTLSLRRATYPAASCRPHVAFSIHALLAESDSSYSLLARLARFFYPRSPCGERPSRCAAAYLSWIFYPRSPCGERRNGGDVADALQVFSIHALLAESDSQHEKINSTNYKFSIHALLAESDFLMQKGGPPGMVFYPRSPCGERQ